MKRKEVETLVTKLTALIQALPNSSTIEPLDLKARESAGVYETEYSRNSVDDKTTEYLDRGRKNFCVYREKSSLIRSRYV